MTQDCLLVDFIHVTKPYIHPRLDSQIEPKFVIKTVVNIFIHCNIYLVIKKKINKSTKGGL